MSKEWFCLSYISSEVPFYNSDMDHQMWTDSSATDAAVLVEHSKLYRRDRKCGKEVASWSKSSILLDVTGEQTWNKNILKLYGWSYTFEKSVNHQHSSGQVSVPFPTL